ncbi:MAG: monofunctional biosynthetic peptidoglycan transglycosylase [Flavobacteriales bacterium]|nr:monofunctional biosynthetic peptidoglycan transglycosylase [Flavobacteriales bacterium]
MAKKIIPKKAKPARSGKSRHWFKRILRFIGFTILALFLFSVGMVVIYRFVPVPVTILQLTRCVEQFQEDKPMVLYKDWEPLENISNKLQLAVVCAEDQKFLNHYGFDVEAIEKAIEHNNKGKKVRGASTISQQTAKNVFLWEGRTWVRKGLEVYFTGLIELIWSKERIMEVYLNVIEMGDGIYGAQAASKHYFRKDASKLSSAEAALLASILPSPRRYSVVRPSGFVRGRQSWTMGQMSHWGGKLDYDNPPVHKEKKKKKRK